ncbi:MAG: hypothetical protein PHZ26_05965 [Candidatus Gracilibacteria bacterium]|nr:hypothetical protein [Candidatus Gracilibacteria bacterium]MDD2909259.1 hypothetical protein [Candidatus Gracilibacteria bacterium]
MSPFIIVLLLIVGVIVIFNITMIVLIKIAIKKINAEEANIIETFFSKVNKIPALVEIMKKYTNHPDIFEDILYLHKLGIIYSIKNIYDMLELNSRTHREFQFLMKLSAKIPELHRDGNFLYIRNYVIFYENNLEKNINSINNNFAGYNRLLKIKNLSILGLLIPYQEKMVF